MMIGGKLRARRARLVLILAAALLCRLLSGCAEGSWSETAPEPMFSAPVFVTPEATEAVYQRPSDGVLTLLYSADRSMNPFISGSETNRLLAGLLYEPMIYVTPGFHAEPGVLESWTQDSGVLFRFSVKSGLRFSDGSDVRNWDVLYSLNRAREDGSHYQSRLADIAEAYIEGDGLVIRLNAANPSFPLRLDIPVVKEGTAYSDLPVGSGPYVMTKTDSGAELKASLTYPETLPLQSVSLVSLPTEQLNAAFSEGTVDMLVTSTGTDAGFLVPGDAERRYLDTSVFHFLYVSPDSRALSDPDRRRLVSAALNRGSISSLLGGNAALLPLNTACGYVRGEWAEDWLPKDLEAFKINILTEDYDGDGVLEFFVDGEPRDMILRLLYRSDSSASTLAANRIRTDLQGTGISVVLVPAEADEYRALLRGGDYDLCLAALRLTSDFDLTSLLCSGGSFYYSLCSEALQQEVRAFKAAQEEDREEHAHGLCVLLAQECPILPICFDRDLMVIGRGVAQGLDPTWTDPYRRAADWQPGMI